MIVYYPTAGVTVPVTIVGVIAVGLIILVWYMCRHRRRHPPNGNDRRPLPGENDPPGENGDNCGNDGK